jgi:hypothetical protein
MNYFDLYSSYPDHTIAAAWDSQIKEANKAPWIAETLNQHSNLFPRFAACYAELRALPRGARRSLQRKLARSSELAAVLPEYLQQGGRRLQQRMAWSLAGAALLLALSQGIATAATITVTTNNPNIAADGQCSLIEAIVNANNDVATHADCAAGSGADTIVLPASANVVLSAVYALSYGQFGSPIGLPLITSKITIEGNGATIARQAGAPPFRIMGVRGNFPPPPTPGNLTLRSVALSGGFSGVSNSFGGTLTIQNSNISSNTGFGVSNSGTLAIANSSISNNTDRGVFNSGTLFVENSTISGNTTGFGGGGIYNIYGALTIENSTISGNLANHGGGVSNYAGDLTITNSTISGNTANHGGGVSNSPGCYYAFPCIDGTLTLNNSLIAGNTASDGGGMANFDTATIENSTISGNTAADRGGGIFNSGSLTITNSTISGNSANYGSDVFNAVTIGASTLATAEVGVSFTGDLIISGGVAPYIVSIAQGRLPRGLSLGNDGVISGTPSPTAKSETITVRVTDSFNDSVTKTFTITVLKALRIAGKPKTTGRLGREYSSSLKTKGGLGPFNWSITSGVLPAGLSFNTTTGAITGIPEQAGTFPLTVQVTDALSGVDVENLTLKIR